MPGAWALKARPFRQGQDGRAAAAGGSPSAAWGDRTLSTRAHEVDDRRARHSRIEARCSVVGRIPGTNSDPAQASEASVRESVDLLRRYEPVVRLTRGELFLPSRIEDYLAAALA